jgi:MFS family permease
MQTAASNNTATEPSGKTAIFSIVCGGHFVNHFQSAMLGVIYPLMMKELGMSYLAIASLASVYNTLGSILQASYGFIVPYLRRGVILGIGNCLLGLSVVASGFASTFSQFFTARLIGGVGSSPQHPVGSSMLASHYSEARGRALAFHTTAGQIGGLLAPVLAAVLVTWFGWRGVFWFVGALARPSCRIWFEVRVEGTGAERPRRRDHGDHPQANRHHDQRPTHGPGGGCRVSDRNRH